MGTKREWHAEPIYTGIGQTRARQYMDKIGATKQFGRRVLFDKNVIDSALDEIGS